MHRRSALWDAPLSELSFGADAADGVVGEWLRSIRGYLPRGDFYPRSIRSSASRSPVDGPPLSKDGLVFWRVAGETCSNAVLRSTCYRIVAKDEHLLPIGEHLRTPSFLGDIAPLSHLISCTEQLLFSYRGEGS